MLRNLWMLQIVVIICILVLVFLVCILTDLPQVLGLSFSKKETIEKYIEKNFSLKNKVEKGICTFRIIGSKSLDKIEEVYIFMCICKYVKKDRKINLIDESYRKGIVTITRDFGIYKVVDIKAPKISDEEYFPKEIVETDEYKESVNAKEMRFLKEANLKKAKKKFKLKKAFKV